MLIANYDEGYASTVVLTILKVGKAHFMLYFQNRKYKGFIYKSNIIKGA